MTDTFLISKKKTWTCEGFGVKEMCPWHIFSRKRKAGTEIRRISVAEAVSMQGAAIADGQVLSGAPKLNTDFDTTGILFGVQFLFMKIHICPINNRFYLS